MHAWGVSTCMHGGIAQVDGGRVRAATLPCMRGARMAWRPGEAWVKGAGGGLPRPACMRGRRAGQAWEVEEAPPPALPHPTG
jgi:hypothetical protein